MMASHQLVAKCVMFEEAARVPLLIRLPRQQQSKVITGPVSQIDLVPTLLDLMDQPAPSHLQGKTLTPLIESGGQSSDDIFIEWNGPNGGFGDIVGKVRVPDFLTELATPEQIEQALRDPVRTIVTPDGWKFNCSPMGEHELYNLNDDPFETTNLARSEQHQNLIKQLAARIHTWQSRTRDCTPLP